MRKIILTHCQAHPSGSASTSGRVGAERPPSPRSCAKPRLKRRAARDRVGCAPVGPAFAKASAGKQSEAIRRASARRLCRTRLRKTVRGGSEILGNPIEIRLCRIPGGGPPCRFPAPTRGLGRVRIAFVVASEILAGSARPVPRTVVLVVRHAEKFRMVEAGGIEPPSGQESPKLLRACLVFKSRHDHCRPTGHDHRQHPHWYCSPGRLLALCSDLLSSFTPPSRYQQVNVVALIRPRELILG